MGLIEKKVKLTNVKDKNFYSAGYINKEDVRSIEIKAIIDTGARMLCIPEDVAEKLGLEKVDKKTVRYANGEKAIRDIGSEVELELMDRRTTFKVLIEKPGAPVLVGHIPLEDLDLVVDMSKEELTVNPESPHMPMAYMY